MKPQLDMVPRGIGPDLIVDAIVPEVDLEHHQVCAMAEGGMLVADRCAQNSDDLIEKVAAADARPRGRLTAVAVCRRSGGSLRARRSGVVGPDHAL